MVTFARQTTGKEVVAEYGSRVKGKTIVITGTSEQGLGAETALTLAPAEPEHLVLIARSANKVQSVVDQIKQISPQTKVTFVAIELSSFDSIRKGASEINALVNKIDILINNAGIMYIEKYTKSVDGFELQLATNHLGPFLFTNLVLDKIRRAGKGARIVNLTSDGHRISPFKFDDYNFSDGKTYDGWSGYGQSKSANILFTKYLAAQLADKGILSFAVHPGQIYSTPLVGRLADGDLAKGLEVTVKNTGRDYDSDDIDGSPDVGEPRSAQEGVSTTLVAALDPRIEADSGAYVANCVVSPSRPWTTDSGDAERLWKLSEQLVGQEFSI